MMDKNEFCNDNDWLRKAKRPFRVIIIGAGIGGLTTAIGLHKTGHQVIVLEQAHKITEIGAGIQAAPNATRVFSRFGLLEDLKAKTNVLRRISIRRYANGEELSSALLSPYVWEEFQSPVGVIHRGDLQSVLLRTAVGLGIDIRTSHQVMEVDKEFAPRVRVKSGKWIEGDFVVAADGIKSVTRAQMNAIHGYRNRVSVTGDSAYRILIPRDQMVHDEEMVGLLDNNIGVRWIGPGGHIMAYPLQSSYQGNGNRKQQNGIYNMVLIHPSSQKQDTDSNEESWIAKGSKEEMLEFYSGWAPVVQKLLRCAPEEEIMEWTLNMHLPLPTWVKGRVALLGDASHPMLPYVAQGMASAVEDSGALAEIFTHTDDIDLGLKVYQHVRKWRAERIQQSTLDTQRALHLPDGPEQIARDQAMRDAMKGTANPDRWSDKAWQEFMWGTDVMKIIRETWEKLIEEVQDTCADDRGKAVESHNKVRKAARL